MPTPEARLYQRLIALDDVDAIDVAEDYAKQHGLVALHEAVVIPALGLCEQDRHHGAIDKESERVVFDTIRKIIEDVEDVEDSKGRAKGTHATAERSDSSPGVVAPCIPFLRCASSGRTTKPTTLPDLLLLASCLRPSSASGRRPSLPRWRDRGSMRRNRCQVVCISALPPNATIQAGYLAKRLKRNLPETKILVVLWTSEDTAKAQARLREAGADEVATSISGAIEQVRQLVLPVSLRSHATAVKS